MNVEVNDSPSDGQFQAWLGDAFAGLAAYELDVDTITFTHTVVEPEFEGKGVGGALARFALDDARQRGLGVIALCPFMARWISNHPDYGDLLVHRPAD